MEALPNVVFLVLLFGVFYLLVFRPQKKRQEERRRLIESVEVGDEVVTIGGLYGTVRAIGDEEVELEVSPGTRVRFIKSAIGQRVREDVSADHEEA